MAAPAGTAFGVYLGHASPSDDAICQELARALQSAGVGQLHYEMMQQDRMNVMIVGELRGRPIHLYLISSAVLQNAMIRKFADAMDVLLAEDPLRGILPIAVAPYDPAELWPSLRAYPCIEAAPGKPWPQAELIRRTLQTLALAPLPTTSVVDRLRGDRGAPPDAVTRAKALHWQGKDAEARAILERETRDHPSFAGWYALGALNEEQHLLPLAILAYDKALAIDPRHPWGWTKRAFALDQMRQYDAALDATQHALAVDPDHAGAWYTQGYILDDMNRLDEALAAYQRSLALDATRVSGWSNMGITLRKMGRLSEAEAAQRQALALSPDFASGWVNLANVLLDQQQYAAALEATQKALQLASDNPTFRYTQARALIALKRYPEALAELQRCGNFPPAIDLRTRLMQAMGQ